MNTQVFIQKFDEIANTKATLEADRTLGSTEEHPFSAERQSLHQPAMNLSMLSATQPAPDISELRTQSKVAIQHRNYTQALEILSVLISQQPNNAHHYNNRGLIYFQLGEIDQAIADYNRAIKLNRQLATAYNNRGNAYAAQGKLVAAIVNYDKAIDLNPVYLRAWINRGITFRDLEQYELALENFDYALYLGSLQGKILLERGRTYHLMGDWNCAISDYQQALSYLQESDCDIVLHRQAQAWLTQLLAPLMSA
jgi:tetratricopeptide (TPR) repeat protein